jgi:hypothetical protein
MPYLSIQTNRALPDEKQTEPLGAALKIVASDLGKLESYVRVSSAPAVRLTFTGEESPTAFLELRISRAGKRCALSQGRTKTSQA